MFKIELHGKDLPLLKQIQSFFGVGSINVRKKNNQVIFTVSSLKDLINVIIPHFDKYPLITQKRADFELFKKVVALMNNKKHLTEDGLLKIVAIRASMNLGCGYLMEISQRHVVEFRVTKLSNILNIIIPFFDKHLLVGEKRLNYFNFIKISLLMKDKAHLTEEGLIQIKKIKADMNTLKR
jgi:hypothetical protein